MLNNQRGMSLVSVMVAIGLTGVLAVILMNLSEQQTKQTKRALVDGELTEVFAAFVKVVNQKTACNATFVGLKKGDEFVEFRFSFDENQDPFAEVDAFFRGTKLKLKKMKILTDAEVISRGLQVVPKQPNGSTTLVMEVTLEKPENVVGGKEVKKTFDVNVAMGKGEILKMADPVAVQDECNNRSGGDGCIAGFDDGECNTTNPAEEMVDGGTFWYGYCFDPTPASSTDDIIVRCWDE